MTALNRKETTKLSLSDEEIDLIAEAAAKKAVELMTDKIYHEVGRGVISRLMWLVGACVIGGYLWLQHKGIIK